MSGARGYIAIAIVVAGILVSLSSLSGIDHTQRNTEILTEMVYSKAAESFTANRVLPGGLTQQPLMAGVIPRGTTPIRFGVGSDEAQRAGRELMNPYSAGDLDRLERGRNDYGIYCVSCHDSAGNGQGPVTLRGMLRPPSLHAARAMQMADGEMFHIITFGQGNMASHAPQITPQERWQIILHVRTLQEQNQ